jgi:hypothetical protein
MQQQSKAGRTHMPIIRFITRAFIDVFGITHPTPQQEQRATIFITTLLSLIVAGLALFLLVLYRMSHR